MSFEGIVLYKPTGFGLYQPPIVKCNCGVKVQLYDIGDGKFFDERCPSCKSLIIALMSDKRWSMEPDLYETGILPCQSKS